MNKGLEDQVEEYIAQIPALTSGPMVDLDYIRTDAPVPPGMELTDEETQFYRLLQASKPPFLSNPATHMVFAIMAKQIVEMRAAEKTVKDLEEQYPDVIGLEYEDQERILRMLKFARADRSAVRNNFVTMMEKARVSIKMICEDVLMLSVAQRAEWRISKRPLDAVATIREEVDAVKEGNSMESLFAE